MTAQVQAGSLFSGARGVWVFGNAGISARENFKMRNGAIQSSGGPRGCSQEIDGLRYHRQKRRGPGAEPAHSVGARPGQCT